MGEEDPQEQHQRPHRSAIAQLDSQQFDMWEAVGGVRGLIESVAPGVVFILVFVLSHDLLWAIASSLVLAAVAMVLRLLGKSSLTQAVGGLAGILIGAVWAWRTGEAQDFFLWGLIVNAGFALGAAVSALVRHPIVGVVVKAFAPRTASVRGARGVFTAATWLWAGAFGLRLAVQVPLYLNSHVGWLGTARVLMGVPLWALVLWFTWLMVRPVVNTAQDLAPQDLPSDLPELYEGDTRGP